MDESPPRPRPRVTILTPCLNAERYVAAAVESVRRQRYPDLEHIVLDAGSKDGTLAVLGRFPDLQVISEPDEGSHDAMNKGLRLAAGEIIGFLNTDDLYAGGLLNAVGDAFAADPDLDVVCVGTVVFVEDEDGSRHVLVARDHLVDNGFWLSELAFGAPGFNGRFFRRRLFERIGNFDLRYFYSADRHFLVRVALSGAKSRTLPRFGYFFRSHPGSFTLNAMQRNAEAFAREHIPQSRAFAGIARASGERRLFFAWHAFDSAKLAYFALKRGAFGSAVSALWRVTLADPLWALRLPLAFACRKEVRRREAQSTAQMSDPIPG